MLYLFLLSVQLFGTFRTNLNRRRIQIEASKQASRFSAKSTSDMWYFVHFDSIPDFSLLSKQGINVNTRSMINKLWYSLFLTPTQAQYLSKIASLRPVYQKEKIINFPLIKYSDYIQFEASSTFNPSEDLPSNLLVDKLSSTVYQLHNTNNPQHIQSLSSNDKIYSIWPNNKTIYFNSRGSGYVQYNTQTGQTTERSKDIVSITRFLENKGLTGAGETILIADSYLDTNSTYFYDPNHPQVEYAQLIEDHRKIRYIYGTPISDNDKINAHGTHVSGCAAGCSHLSSSESDAHLYNGIATGAKIAFTMNNFIDIIRNVMEKTSPSVSSNSWGERGQTLSTDNLWNNLAREHDETLIAFAAGNFGLQNNENLDYYETAISPSLAKNILTVGALSSLPIENEDDFEKQIYILSYKPLMKKWSLRSDESVQNPSVDELFTKGSVSDAKLTYNTEEDFSKNKRILIINGKDEFLNNVNKENPPFMVISISDFDVDENELKGFSRLFPVVILDNETVNSLLDASSSVYVETNLVSSKTAKISRADFSSKGLAEIGIMKPEIMGPGTAVISAKSDPFGDYGHADYLILDGTSFATPLVSGAATLLVEYFKGEHYRPSLPIVPSSSLLKSVLINAADPLNRSEPHPNADTGFGQLNLGKYIMNGEGADSNVLIGDHIEVIGDQHLYAEVNVINNDRDFRVTISYLDEVLNDDSSVALVVDLDLVVVAPDGKTVYRGNQRVDNTEEMFSTIERVLINKEEVQTGTYEIHIFTHVPDVVRDKKSEFAICVFGSINHDSNTLSFQKATKCVPVVEGHGKCNEETSLNVCEFDEMMGDGFNGHSCQNEIIAMNDDFRSIRSKRIIEIEPYGVKYVNAFYPLGEGKKNITLIIASLTNFSPKYAYKLNVEEKNPLMREIDADNVIMKGDFANIITNYRSTDFDLKSGVYAMVYNKSPVKTKFIISYLYSISDDFGEETPTPVPQPETPTPVPQPETPTPVPQPETSTPVPQPETSTPVPQPETSTPVPQPETSTPVPQPETSTPVPQPETPAPTQVQPVIVNKNVVLNDYLIPFIIVMVACVILFVIVVILAVSIIKRRTADPRSEQITESLRSPLF